MKGLILSGGKGTRLRPFTYTGAKQLVPVANKPVLFYAIEDLVEAGITDIGIVVGDTAEQVMGAVGDGSRFGAKITYIRQEQPLGIAHGVKISEPFLQKEPFVLFLGDNLLCDGILPLVEKFRHGGMHSLILLTQVKNPQNFGIAECYDGRVVRLVEKPREPKSDLAVVGIYLFDHHVFEAINNIQPSARGELEITETIQYLIDRGFAVKAHHLTGHWTDTGKMDDILEANRWLLETLEEKIEGTVDSHSSIYGKLILEPGAEIVNSVIRGPVAIAQGTKIVNSFIGPYTSIYYDCLIANSEVEHSIVMENCRIMDIEHRIGDSLVGRSVEVTKSPAKPKTYRLVLGDHSKVEVL
ncbi:MAG: glucose-1-phosphate thymidylyltransferase [Chloroflexi bacterium]|nr:glucose-1-phosphate thymidylyltransferase [Chloroflexota bacterium]